MRHIGFDKKFTLLAQEAHLTKNSLLSGFELLLKANFFQDKEGYFYSSFFHLSIGMERLLKLAVVTHHMLTNDYHAPTIAQLKNKFGHNIKMLYTECENLIPQYRLSGAPLSKLDDTDQLLIDFFSEYASNSRYFNLNAVCEEKMSRSPLDKWLDVSRKMYEKYTPYQARQKSAMALIYGMDRNGRPNGFTSHLNEDGHPMTVFDCLHRQYVIQKSAPLLIWRMVSILKPVHFLLDGMSYKASEYERANNIPNMVIPHYGEFFYFLLADRTSIKRRKKWLELFNG